MATPSSAKKRRAHKRSDIPLTADRLRQLVHYDPLTGVFRRRTDWGTRKAGDVLGSVGARGYIVISVDGKNYTGHRLAWLYVRGVWPPEDREIDHENRNKADNAWSNLRLATHAQNLINVALHSHNTSGYRGVCRYQNIWRAYTKIGGRQISLGYFKTKEEAAEAYSRAAPALHGEFFSVPPDTGV